MLMIEDTDTNLLELYQEEYKEEFAPTSLKFSYPEINKCLESYPNNLFLLWIFKDMTHHMMGCYENWNNKYLGKDDILGYGEENNVKTYGANLDDDYTYKLKERINHYLDNEHSTYKIIKLSGSQRASVIETYKRFLYEWINNGHLNHKSLGYLFEQLFDNYYRKVRKVGHRKYNQTVHCSMLCSNGDIITMTLTIFREYYFSNFDTIEKYMNVENSFEWMFRQEFDRWFNIIKPIIYDQDSFDEYIHINSHDIAKIKNDFRMPYHCNQLLVNHMIKLRLNNIGYMESKIRKAGTIILVEQYFWIHGANYYIDSREKESDSRCFIHVEERPCG